MPDDQLHGGPGFGFRQQVSNAIVESVRGTSIGLSELVSTLSTRFGEDEVKRAIRALIVTGVLVVAEDWHLRLRAPDAVLPKSPMDDREKVLLQRDAVRRYWEYSCYVSNPEAETVLRALFPLPPRREPRVVSFSNYDFSENRLDTWEFRCIDGVVECQINNQGWLYFAHRAVADAVTEVLEVPYIEVPERSE